MYNAAGGLGFFVTLWLSGFWQGWQWNNPSIPFIDTVVGGWPGRVTIKLGYPVLPKVGRGIFLGHTASHTVIVGARKADPPRTKVREG